MIYSIVGDGKTVLSETTTEVFMRQINVRKTGQRTLLQMGVVEVDMPIEIAEELVWDMMEMLNDDALRRLIKVIEEKR